MSVLLPKERVDDWGGVPLFFFAGPVRGGGDWQLAMYQALYNVSRGAFCAAVPMRYRTMEPPHPLIREVVKVAESTTTFPRQLAWERHYLRLAAEYGPSRPGCLVFWLGLESVQYPHPGPEPYAMDTRRELGEWSARLELLGRERVRIVIGADPAFHGLDQIKRVFSEAIDGDFPIHASMEDTALAAYRAAFA